MAKNLAEKSIIDFGQFSILDFQVVIVVFCQMAKNLAEKSIIDFGQFSILDFRIAVKSWAFKTYYRRNNMPFLFERLDVYQKAMQLADEVTEVSEAFPRGKYYLREQLDRALLSITNNIAEGNGRFTKNDKIHFFHIARGSAFESVSILDMCFRKRLITGEQLDGYRKQLDDICKMISGLIKRQDK